MTLDSLLRDYSIERGIRPSTEDQLRFAIRCFAKHLARQPRIADLQRETLNEYLTALQEAGRLKPRTIAGRRDSLVSLWRFAHEIGATDTAPARVRRVKVPEAIPKAWTIEELQRIVQAARELDPTLYLPNGIQYRVYFPALIEFAYYSGLPRVDLFELTTHEVRKEPGGAIIVHRRVKTQHPMVCSVPPACYQAFLQLGFRIRRDGHAGWQTPLRWPLSLRMLYHRLNAIKDAAGVPREGALHQLRRTGATHVARAGGCPQSYLNHSDPRLARKHYVDALQLGESVRPQDLRRAK